MLRANNNNYNISMIEEEEDALLSNEGGYSPDTGVMDIKKSFLMK